MSKAFALLQYFPSLSWVHRFFNMLKEQRGGTFQKVSLQRYLWWEQHHVLLVFSRRKANEHLGNHDPHEKGDVKETEHTKRLLDTLLTKTCIFQNNVSSHNHRLQFWTSNTQKPSPNTSLFICFYWAPFPTTLCLKGVFFGASIFVGGMATHHGTDEGFVVFFLVKVPSASCFPSLSSSWPKAGVGVGTREPGRTSGLL